MGKRTKAIIDWIEAYNKLMDINIKYFVMSINTNNKQLQKKYRKLSDQYNDGVNKLIDKLP